MSTANRARQEETASNGLTRREINASLEARHIEFDPRASVQDLAAALTASPRQEK